MASFPLQNLNSHNKKATLLETSIISFNKTAMESLHTKNYTAAKSLLHRSLEMLKYPESSDSILKLKSVTYNNLGILYKHIKDYEKSLHYLTLALEVSDNLQNDDQNKAGTHLNICAIRSEINQHEKALQHALIAVKILLKGGHEYSKNLIVAFHSAGIEYQIVGLPLKAVQCFERGYNLALDTLGRGNQLTQSLENAMKDFHGYKARARQRSTDYFITDLLGTESQKFKFDPTPWKSPNKSLSPLKNSIKRPYKLPVTQKNRPLDYSFLDSPEKIGIRKLAKEQLTFKNRDVIGKHNSLGLKNTERKVVSDMKMQEKNQENDSEKIFDKFKEDLRKSEMMIRSNKDESENDVDFYYAENDMWEDINEHELQSENSKNDKKRKEKDKDKDKDKEKSSREFRMETIEEKSRGKHKRKTERKKEDRSVTELKVTKKYKGKRMSNSSISEEESSLDSYGSCKSRDKRKKVYEEKHVNNYDLYVSSGYERRKHRKNDDRDEKRRNSLKKIRNEEENHEEYGQRYRKKDRKRNGSKKRIKFSESSENSENTEKSYRRRRKKSKSSVKSSRENSKKSEESEEKSYKKHKKDRNHKEKHHKKHSKNYEELYNHKSKQSLKSITENNSRSKHTIYSSPSKQSQVPVSNPKNNKQPISDYSNIAKIIENSTIINHSNSPISSQSKNQLISLPSASLLPAKNASLEISQSSHTKKSTPDFQPNKKLEKSYDFSINQKHNKKDIKNHSEKKSFSPGFLSKQEIFKTSDTNSEQIVLKKHNEISTQTISESSSRSINDEIISMVAVREKNSQAMLKNSQKILKNSEIMLKDSENLLKGFESYKSVYRSEQGDDTENENKLYDDEENDEENGEDKDEENDEDKDEDKDEKKNNEAQDMKDNTETSDIDHSRNTDEAGSGYQSDIEDVEKNSVNTSEKSYSKTLKYNDRDKKNQDNFDWESSSGNIESDKKMSRKNVEKSNSRRKFPWSNSYKNNLKSNISSSNFIKKRTRHLENSSDISSQTGRSDLGNHSIKNSSTTKSVREKTEESNQSCEVIEKNSQSSLSYQSKDQNSLLSLGSQASKPSKKSSTSKNLSKKNIPHEKSGLPSTHSNHSSKNSSKSSYKTPSSSPSSSSSIQKPAKNNFSPTPSNKSNKNPSNPPSSSQSRRLTPSDSHSHTSKANPHATNTSFISNSSSKSSSLNHQLDLNPKKLVFVTETLQKIDKKIEAYTDYKHVLYKSEDENSISSKPTTGSIYIISAIRIQKWVRMWLTKKKFLRIKKSLIIIQKAWRDFRYKRYLEKVRFVKSDFTQQFHPEMLVEKKEKKDLAMQTEEKVRPDVFIVTSELVKIKPYRKYKQFFRSIVMIQSCVRGFLIRAKNKKARTAATKIQSLIRMHTIRNIYLLVLQAIITIQQHYRKHLSSKKAKAIINSNLIQYL